MSYSNWSGYGKRYAKLMPIKAILKLGEVRFSLGTNVNTPEFWNVSTSLSGTKYLNTWSTNVRTQQFFVSLPGYQCLSTNCERKLRKKKLNKQGVCNSCEQLHVVLTSPEVHSLYISSVSSMRYLTFTLAP